MLRILIEDSEGKSKVAPIDLDSGDVTIGRKEGNFIRLKERNVSRKHARIYLGDNGLMIEPVAARYGLKLNSKKIEGPMPLELGDEIRIGDYRLYIQDESQPSLVNNDNADVVSDIEPELQPRFVVISSNFAGREYHVMRTKVIIGRDPNCDIQIGHASVSSRHTEIRRTARGDFEVRDLGSSNGTKINGYTLTEAYRINSGDVIMLGHVIMRYCAPGDFWSLNFGINDEPRRNNGLIVVLVAVIVFLAIGLTYFITTNGQSDKPQEIIKIDDSANKDAQFLSKIMECKDLTDQGNFEEARKACQAAHEINPEDTRYIIAIDKLNKEESAQKTVNDIKKAIQEGQCRDAIQNISNVNEGTLAYSKMHADNLKEQANECLAKTLYHRAMKSIENSDFADAEFARDEIKEVSPSSSYIGEINDKLRANRPRSGGSGSSKSSAPKAQADDAPKSASSGVNVAAICKQAVQAKIKKKNCEAYKLYKKALSAGGADATCTRNANKHISDFKKECD